MSFTSSEIYCHTLLAKFHCSTRISNFRFLQTGMSAYQQLPKVVRLSTGESLQRCQSRDE